MLVSPRGVWESAPSMSESATTQRGTDLRTDGLYEAQWHFADASVGALPHAARNYDGRFGAAESAGWRSILCTRVCEKKTHTYAVALPLSQLSEKHQPTHHDKWLAEASLCFSASFLFLRVQHLITVSSPHSSVFKSLYLYLLLSTLKQLNYKELSFCVDSGVPCGKKAFSHCLV